MVVITVTSTEAQSRLAELLEKVDQGRVTITREGRPDAFLVSSAELEDLVDARRRSEAVARWEAWKVEAKKHLTPAAAELTDEDINRLVHELR
jgi:prevent-host-death family protein